MTPMPNAPNPNAIFGEALARTPAPLPLSTVQEQMAQTAGLNAQAQETALGNQFKARKLNNLKLIHDNVPGLLQASGNKWDDSVFNGLAAKGVDPDEIESLRGLHLTNDEKASQTAERLSNVQKANAALADHARDVAGRTAYAINHNAKNPDGSYDPVKVEGVISNLEASDPQWAAAGHGQELRKLYSTNAPAFAGRMAAAEQMAPEATIAELEPQKTQAGIELTKAQAGAQAAQARLTSAEAGMSEKQLQFMNDAIASPSSMNDAIDKLISPKTYPEINARTKDEFQMQMRFGGPKAASQVLVTAVSHINALEEGVSKELNPDIREAHIQDDLRKAKLLRAGDNPAVARVAPSEIAPATLAANKLDEEYIKAAGASEDLGRFLDLADKGNVAAGANISLVGVGALNAVNGIRRLNAAEINRYGNAGSLLEKVQGKLRGWTEGIPISSDVINDIREAHQQLAEQSYKNYTTGLSSLNKRTLADFGPTVPPVTIRKGPAPVAAPTQHKVGDTVRLKGGRTVTIKAIHSDGTFDY